ncbi:MAG: hypothetical protein ACTSSH_07115 [Candidatus Heimdallarchaeota archaeon]
MKVNQRAWELLALIFVIGLIATTQVYANTAQAINEENILNFKKNENILVNDFENFTQVLDDPNIYSDNSGYNVYFKNDAVFTGNKTEAYIINFANLGNCSDFNMQLTFNYTNFLLDDIMEFYLVAGSFYDFNGDYLGEETSEKSMMTSVGIRDDRLDSRGKFAIITEYNVSTSYHTTAYNTTGEMADISVQIVRNESGIYREISYVCNGSVIIEHSLPAGIIDRPLNYVALYYKTAATPNTNIHVLCNSFLGNFTFDNITQFTPPPNTTYPTTITFPGFTMLLAFATTTFVGISCLIIKRKK